MLNYVNYIVPVIWMLMTIVSPARANEFLTLDAAVQIALERDSKLQAFQARSASLQEKSVADNTLPDPKLKLGLMNFPTDTYDRDQEPMTQVQVGLQQMFPAGQTLSLRSQQTSSMALAEAARAEDQKRQLYRNVRQTWLELYYWIKAEKVITQDRQLFSKLVKITQSQYSSGRQNQQDVLRAELELGKLDDRKRRILIMKDKTWAKLVKYIGQENAQRKLSLQFPELSPVYENSDWLTQHPLMQLEDAKVTNSEQGVSLARQSYKPAWMLDVTYGVRDGLNPNGTERTDFVSAMVMVDLPFFTGNRQDRNVAASKYKLNSALNAREERERMLRETWQASYAMWQHHAERNSHFQNVLVPVAKENTRASLSSYQSRRGDFNSLMRAQIMELETQLNALRVKVEHAKLQAQLLYLAGEVQ